MELYIPLDNSWHFHFMSVCLWSWVKSVCLEREREKKRWEIKGRGVKQKRVIFPANWIVEMCAIFIECGQPVQFNSSIFNVINSTDEWAEKVCIQNLVVQSITWYARVFADANWKMAWLGHFLMSFGLYSLKP